MAYEGSLSESSFPEVLQHIGRTSGTGILTLQGQEEIIGVTFLDGEVVSVDAVNQAPEDGLGHVLEEVGLVSREEFSSLVAEHQAGGGRVIDLLVERGYVDRRQLLDALRRQTLRLCADACAWEEGQFRFYRGDQVSYEHGIEPINVDDLLARLAAARAPATAPPAEPEPLPVVEPAGLAVEESASFPAGPFFPDPEEVPEVEILRIESQMSPPPPVEMPTLTPPPVEMPDLDYWSSEDDDPVGGGPKRRSWLDYSVDWASITAPLLPGRLLGLGMLVGLAALTLLAPERILLPLAGQERIRAGLISEVQDSLFAKVDQAAKTFFLLRGEFPAGLDELRAMNLLGAGDGELSGGRRLAYTEAPVSYLLAIEGEVRLDAKIRTETISGNFLLDPDFSPPELLDTAPLVLLD